MKKILAAAMMFLAAGPAMAQEWALSTVLGDMNIEALAVAPNGTAWAGQSNSIYRFDGSAWSVVTTVTGWADVEFFGAVAPANDRAYFSGCGYPPAGGSKASFPASIYLPIVLRQSGGANKSLSWWEVGLLQAPWEYSAHLYAAANGSGGYDVWAAGGGGGIHKSSNDGASWESHTSNVTGVGYFSGIAGSGPSDIWAAGADSARYYPCLYHWDGANWNLFTSNFSGSSPVVSVPTDGTPWYAFGGMGAEVGRWNGSWDSLTAIPNHWPKCLTSNPQTSEVWLGTENTSTHTGGIYHYDGVNWQPHTSLPGPVWSLDASYPGVVWAATTGAVYNLGWRPGRRDCRGDYTGDGSTDIAIFRQTNGLWAVRGYTRLYFGGSPDAIVPRDYSGDGSTNVAVFRQTNGLWAIRGYTRAYFGGSGDTAVPGDYRGDGSADIAIFRRNNGLWSIRGYTRSYFGDSSDVPVPGDYSGDGSSNVAIYRSSTGLWSIRGYTRYYFGGSSDVPVPGDYNGDGTWTPAIFRPANGLWTVKGITRAYFGISSDYPVTGDYRGDGSEIPAIYRGSNGLWAIRGYTRAYFGQQSDIPALPRPWWTE